MLTTSHDFRHHTLRPFKEGGFRRREAVEAGNARSHQFWNPQFARSSGAIGALGGESLVTMMTSDVGHVVRMAKKIDPLVFVA